MKNKLVFVVLILLFMGCGPRKHIGQTYATFIKYHLWTRGGNNEWSFNYNGKEYSIVGPGEKVQGAKYVIYFDSLHPTRRYEIDIEKPIFIKGERTKITECTNVYDRCYYPGKKHNEISFEYEVSGKKYSNGIFLPIFKDTLCVKKGDKFELEYWVDNPQRSIIHINKPIK